MHLYLLTLTHDLSVPFIVFFPSEVEQKPKGDSYDSFNPPMWDKGEVPLSDRTSYEFWTEFS